MNERELFLQALEIKDPAERAAFVEEACAGQPDLRRHVNQLLKAHEFAGQFLDQPHPAAAAGEHTGAYASDSGAAEMAGVVIAGRYKLLQCIGEGGMGSVWMADQLEPVKRRVAIKLIQAERDTSRTILSRFEAERQAIALMDHPNIAKLLDAGTTGERSFHRGTTESMADPALKALPAGSRANEGRPYFVMELVKGVPLTQFCDEHKLTIPERLKLFMQICGAVQHAHQKGIIHRDLKPTNILVEMHDDKPVPKVIDFGLAKALSGQPLTEHTLFTAYGTVAGTPLYMAPEQAKFNAIDIDTRADIYALGAIMYELITGSTPIERASLKKAALDEILRVIRDSEPPIPSKRLSTTASKPSIAASRQMEPVKLGRFVKGELDWIVMKALAKERDRRYETASGLAKDIERFLNHEPVLAGPPSAGYRVRKFVRRHRGQVIAASLLLLALLAGIVGTTIGLIRAEQQRQVAEANETKALSEKERADQAAQRESRAAEDLREEQGKTKAALKEAKNERQQAQDRLVRTYVSNGLRQMDQEDLVGSLPWFVKALEEEKGGPEKEEIHRVRLGAVLKQCPRLLQAWEFNHRVSAAVAADYTAQLMQFSDKHPVVYADFSPDGRQVLIADHTRIWDASTGQALTRFLVDKPTSIVYVAQAFSPDGRRLATFGPRPGEITIWDGSSGKPIGEPIKDKQDANGVVFSPDGRQLLIISGNAAPEFVAVETYVANPPGEAQARIWDPITVKPITPPMTHGRSIRHAAFSPDGRWVVTASDDNTARVWDATTGMPITGLLAHSAGVAFAAFSPDSRRIVTVGGRLTQVISTSGSTPQVRGSFRPQWEARLWDAASGSALTPPMVHHRPVNFAAFSPDGKHVVTACGHSQLTMPGEDAAWVWDDTGIAVIPPLRHQATVLDACFSPDGRYVVTASADRTARVWDVATGTPVTPPMPHSHPVHHCVFSPDGGQVLTSNADRYYGGVGEVRLWGLRERAWGEPVIPESWQKKVSLSPDGSNLQVMRESNWRFYASNMSPSPDGRHAVTYRPNRWGSVDSHYRARAQIIDISTGTKFPLEHEGHAHYAAFSSDGRYVVTATDNGDTKKPRGEARVWEAATGRPVSPPMRHDGRVFYATFNSDSSRILTAASDAQSVERDAVYVWKVATGKPVTEPKHVPRFEDAVFSPDGQRVIAVGVGSAWLWDDNTGEPVGSPTSLEGQGVGGTIGKSLASFSPDSRLVIVAVGGTTAQVRDARMGEGVSPLLRHRKRVDHLQFSPDGRRVLTVTEDVVRVFDAHTGAPITPPLVHGQHMRYAIFSPNGRLVATLSSDNGARVWDAATGEPVTPILSWSGERAHFTPDGCRLITVAGGRILTFEIAPEPHPVQDLVRIANLLSCRTNDSEDSLTALATEAPPTLEAVMAAGPPERLQVDPSLQTLRSRYPDEFASAPGDRLAWHRRQARAYQATADFYAAKWHLDRLVEAEPSNGAFLRERGKTHESLGLLDNAIADYSKAIELEPKEAEAWEARGLLYLQKKDWTKALEDYSKAIELNPNDPQIRETRAQLYSLKNDWAKAIEDYSKAIELNPNDSAAWQARGELYIQQKDWTKAINDFSKAIEVNPNSAHAWETRGELYLLRKDWARAIDDFSKAIELEPQAWPVWHFRALAYGEQEQWAKAAADFAKCIELGSSLGSQSAGWHALSLAAEGDAAGHRKACAELLEKFNKTPDPDKANDVAWFCVRFPDAVDDPARPLQLAEMAVAKNPKSHPWLNTLGAALYRAKRFEDSIKKLDEAIEAHGQGGTAADWLFLAMAHHGLGHADDAKKWLSKAQLWIDKAAQEKPKETVLRAITPSWAGRLELKLIRAEAEALIKDEKKK